MKNCSVLISSLIFSFNIFAEVLIYKVRPIPANVRTYKKKPISPLPQTKDHIWLYQNLSKFIAKNPGQIILAEGCLDLDTDMFTDHYYGWTAKSLKSQVNSGKYKEIITHIAAKLKVAHGNKVKIVCLKNSDTEAKLLQTMNELSQFATIYEELIKYKGDRKAYLAILTKLSGIMNANEDSTSGPEDYAKKKALEANNKLKDLLQENSRYIAKQVGSFSGKGPILITDSLQLNWLAKELKHKGIHHRVLAAPGHQDMTEKTYWNYVNKVSGKK